MEKAFSLAGFMAAHAIWNLSERGRLAPFVGTATADGKRQLRRFATGDLARAVEEGRLALRHQVDAPEAVLVYDGPLVLPEGKAEAIFLELRSHHPRNLTAIVAVPYRRASAPRGFAVFRPKFFELPASQTAIEPLVEAFLRGVREHREGAKVWNAKMDQSR